MGLVNQEVDNQAGNQEGNLVDNQEGNQEGIVVHLASKEATQQS